MTLISSQDKVVQQIISTHSPDTNFNVDEKALLSMAIDILCKAISKLNQDLKTELKVSEDKTQQQVITEELAYTIRKIGCELSCNCSGAGGMKSITLAVFDKLVKYSWENKLVIALLAFAVNYGELCLLWKLDATNPLTKYVDQLKLLLEICEQETYISRQETLISGLLEVIMRVTMTIIELNVLSSYFLCDKARLSENQISTAVYLVVKGIVACSSQSIGLVNLQFTVSNTEERNKCTELTDALKTIHVNLGQMLTKCNKEIEAKKLEEGYCMVQRLLESFCPLKTNNEKLFTVLIRTEDDEPLFNGVTNKKESLKVLKGKTVILFISDLDILDEEINEITERVSTPVRPYEIVWFPIVDNPMIEKDVIEKKAGLMKWYSLHYSVTLPPYVIHYIKKDWHFEKKPVMVVFSAHGKVVNSNAYHMIMLWGNVAYPFLAHGEETLWRNSKWDLEFLIDGVASDEWLKEGNLACLFEDDDWDWIKKFICAMKDVVGEGIKLIYVGKTHRETIKKVKSCEWWDDHKIRRFWARLDNIWYSKMKSCESIDKDKTFKDVTMLRRCSDSNEGWTVIGQGSKEIVASNGKATMEALDKMKRMPSDVMSKRVEALGFVGLWELLSC
ncbi:protein SIEVE ELEMENT OCCLUSION B-like protein [Cinnamomum micranthum f. kanehirae]|uniref:Protein SIEVE ELEMENT OCCLUSION B-like protein n=1 Tax=Cinnamomum micranthum f. kanehirae TaxID=337451 RepID=A0A3S3MIK2_9MAGN|nr:protein SIEVE ELEMENT OCCLUSION B-like protein [Cinnamomum micranthum f. kanehirae]